jgi:hypothetical protein
MPALSDLQKRFSYTNQDAIEAEAKVPDDMLIADPRASWSPKQFVERKLQAMLPADLAGLATAPVTSHVTS